MTDFPSTVVSIGQVLAHRAPSVLLATSASGSSFVGLPEAARWWNQPLFHALIGALVGGGLSVLGSRISAEHAQRLRDQRARAALVKRLGLMLESTLVIGVALPDSNPRYATALSTMRELLNTWEPFDAMLPDLHLLADAELERDLFLFCLEVRLESRGHVYSEERFGEVNRDMDHGTERTLKRWRGEARSVLQHRQGVRQRGPMMASRSKQLIDRLHAPATPRR